MDLLGDYDSDEDSSSSSNSLTGPPAGAAGAITVAPPVVAPATTKTTPPTTTTITKRSKKLLKLQAVLPQHIWNQLTNGIPDEDDDDEEDPAHKLSSTATRPNKNSKHTPTYDPKVASAQVSSLLNALPKSKGGIKTGGGGILGKSSGSQEPSSTTSGGLGSAFLTSTVQVTRSKKGTVRSIHTTTQDDDDDDNNGDLKPAAIVAVDTVQKDEEEEDLKEQHPVVVSTTPRYASLQQATPRPSTNLRPSLAPQLPSTAARQRSAAPPIHPRGGATTSTTPAASSQMAAYPTPPLAPPPQQTTSQPLSKKARKKQMEAMLRAGNLNGMQESDMITLQGGDVGGNANYALQTLQQQAHAAASAANYQAHGVRVVPTSHYNTSTGQMDASATISGKQKGKNQLNALLVTAASLEASRLENPQLLRKNTYRNNAKRKYGW